MRIGSIAAAVLLLGTTAWAAFRPSFAPRDVGWHATDIVVVRPSGTCGIFAVSDAWRGDQLPGALLSVPAMCEWESRPQRYAQHSFGGDTDFKATELILFLRRDPAPAGTPPQWLPATFWKDTWQPSFAWITTTGEVMAYVQVMNPGDPVLVRVADSANKLKSDVFSYAAEREDFDKARAITDASQRALALARFIGSKNAFAQAAAMKELQSCGAAAIPVLRNALADDDLLRQRYEVIRTLGNIGGVEAAQAIATYLESEVRFWAKETPVLPQNWWNAEANDPREIRRSHYGAAQDACYFLGELKFPPALPTIRTLRQALSGMPPLDRSSNEIELLNKCDEAIATLEQVKK